MVKWQLTDSSYAADAVPNLAVVETVDSVKVSNPI